MAGKRKVCLVRELLNVRSKREHTQSHSHRAVQVGSSVFYSSELGNKYGLVIDNRGSAGTWSQSRGEPRVGADRLTACRLQSLTTVKIKWSVSNQLITLEIINSNKPKPQPRDNALTNVIYFLPSTE